MTRFRSLLLLLLSTFACAQVYAPAEPAITNSGGTLTIPNMYGAMNVSFEEIPSGSPSTVSVTIQGCMKGGTCDSAFDTNNSTSASIRSVTPTAKVYNYFLVTASWTGGTNASIQVNPS